jgi:hypothetical protein
MITIMSKKRGWSILVLFLFLAGVIQVAAIPPPPPNVAVSPPSYCIVSNGGVEICDGLSDEDCDGVIDNGCSCNVGDNRTCGSDVGICVSGTQYCVNGTWSLTCVGSVSAQTEVCDSLDNDCDGSVDEGVCTVTPPSSGGGGGGGSSRTTTIVQNTTNTTNTSSENISKNIAPIKEPTVIVNTSLVEIIPLADKVENLSMSESNKKLFTIFNFSPLKTFIVGSILMCMVVFLSIFILDYSKKKKKINNNLNNYTLSGSKELSDIKKQEYKKTESSTLQNDASKSSQSKDRNEKTVELKVSAGLSSQELQAVKYINAMRQKGFKDDYIRDQLKSKGWKEEITLKLFKK